MLDFFPTPYPDELWYSILCRYHIRGGYNTFGETLRYLTSPFQYRRLLHMLPNNTITMVCNQLPQDIFNPKIIILNHTLFHFYVRFFDKEYKQMALSSLVEGKNIILKQALSLDYRVGFYLKYCPLCLQEDRECYGESYWHRSHQISTMPLCHKHYCRLITSDILAENTMGLRNPLSLLNGDNLQHEVSTEYQDWEKQLTDVLFDYLTFPWLEGLSKEHNVFVQAARNKGYYTIGYQKQGYFNRKKITNKMIELFGFDFFCLIFEEKINEYITRNITHYQITSPQKVALLQILFQLSTEELFSPFPLKDTFLEKLLIVVGKYKRDSFTKKDAAKELGISKHQFEEALKFYKIEPFWTKRGSCQNVNLQFMIELKEFNRMKEHMQKLGIRRNSDFIEFCIKYTVDHIETNNKNSNEEK